MKGMLWLYPREWRRRYGEEMSLHLDSEKASFGLFLDLLAGAIDARLNPQWIPAGNPNRGEDDMSTIRRYCSSPQPTLAEQRRSAFWIIGASIAFVLLSRALDQLLGMELLAEAVLYSGFPVAVFLSTSSLYLKGHSRQVRAILLIGASVAMFLFMLGITYLGEII